MDNSLEVILNLQKLLDKIPVAERQALSRRIAQLSMDYLVNNIRLKHSLIALNHAIKKLKSMDSIHFQTRNTPRNIPCSER